PSLCPMTGNRNKEKLSHVRRIYRIGDWMASSSGFIPNGIHLIWTAARNEAAVLAYVWQFLATASIPEKHFRRNSGTIDIGIISSQTFMAFPRWNDWLDVIVPECSRQYLPVTSLAARRHSAIISSTSPQACGQSATVPAVTGILTGMHAHPGPDVSLR
ncbi:hypothetical protein, partial [uncultured Desulfovibrio sp.]|uniref:hypothetical protein n=1 Tax=uncultured Desulfovibrio sp. TaxID=167968 RepID=UPI0035A72D69